MIAVSTALAIELAKETMQFAWLITIGDDLRYTNHAVDIVFGGETFARDGDLLRMPSIVRERAIKLQSYTVEFSNVDGATAYNLSHKLVGETVVDYDRTGDVCEVLLVLLGADGLPVAGEAISLYKGLFDSWVERDTDNSATISVKITSPWAKPNLTAGRTTSDFDQQNQHTGDRFFQFAHEERNTIGWGDKA